MNQNSADQNPRVVLIGYGKIGKVLVKSLVALKYKLIAVVDQNPEIVDDYLNERQITCLDSITKIPSAFDFLLICVPDRAIPLVVKELNNSLSSPSGLIIAHTAGSQSAEVLAPLKLKGAQVMAWHPLQTFTGTEGLEHFQGVLFGVDGDEVALELGTKISEDLGGRICLIPPELRPRYHLGGVFACNFLAALVGISVDLMEDCGLDQETALQALEPLIIATVRNIVHLGLPHAITGPLSRDDDGTVLAHQQMLADQPEILKVYQMLSKVLLRQLGKDSMGGLTALVSEPVPTH